MAAKSKSIVVTIADESMHEIQGVADQLRKKGMKVERVLHNAGVITGSSPTAKIAALSKIRGVATVEEEATATLPPPGESPQ